MFIYGISFDLRLADGEFHQATMFATTGVDLTRLQRMCKEHGAQFNYEVEQLEVSPGDSQGVALHISEWAANLVDAAEDRRRAKVQEPAPVAAGMPVNPADARVNEIDRSLRNTERRVDGMDKKLDALVDAVTKLATMSAAREAPAADWREAAQQPTQPQQVPDRQRRSARAQVAQEFPEFAGDQDYRKNSMDVIAGPSASPMPGISPQMGGTGVITVGLNANGEPVVVDVPAQTVGDTFRTGTR